MVPFVCYSCAIDYQPIHLHLQYVEISFVYTYKTTHASPQLEFIGLITGAEMYCTSHTTSLTQLCSQGL